MKLLLIVAVLVAFELAANGQTHSSHLTGCPNLPALAAALEKLQNNRWEDLNQIRVQDMWPTELLCEDSDGCGTLTNRGRIISSFPECAEIFNFDIGTKQLTGGIIYYSTSRKRDTIVAARVLAKSIGVSKSDLATIGNDPDQGFHWISGYDSVKNMDEVSSLGVGISFRKNVWTVRLGFNRPSVDQSPKK
jgi:hypothetical protein